MTLHRLPRDTEPTDRQLEPFLSEWSGLPTALQKRGARLSWRMEQVRRDTNAFLVPFVPTGFPYNTYRASLLWKEIRSRVLSRANRQCVGCDSEATQVHHRDYRPRVLAGEDLKPLVPVCRSCHDAIERARKAIGWNAGEKVLRALVQQKARKPSVHGKHLRARRSGAAIG